MNIDGSTSRLTPTVRFGAPGLPATSGLTAQMRAVAAPTEKTDETAPDPRTASIEDTFTLTTNDPAVRARVFDQLKRLREDLYQQGQDAAKTSEAAGKPQSIQEINDLDFDRGLSYYEKYKDRHKGADPYLTESDKAMVGLMYEKYEKKFGEDSYELTKATRFAHELATLRMMGVLVQSKEDKAAEKARAERRVERAENEAQRKAAEEKADTDRNERIDGLSDRIRTLETAGEAPATPSPAADPAV